MNSEEEKNYIVPLESIIKCCRCYVDYWKDMRNAR